MKNRWLVASMLILGAAVLEAREGFFIDGYRVPAKSNVQDITLRDGKTVRRGIRCGVLPLSDELKAATEADLQAFDRSMGYQKLAAITVPVAFHVVYKVKSGVTTGNVPQSWITNQISVLNAAYSGKGFSFQLVSTDRTNNTKWFDRCYSSGTESQMKDALAIDVPHTLNIYTCNPSNGILGYAYLPQDLPEDHILHGVVLAYGSLPGGTLANYNLGDTATHEIGHYLGLDHTFEGGCSNPGDSVSDTAPEASPAYQCPVGRDTCAGGGVDPIRNFMDYTYDSCMFEFSAGQTSRMQSLTALYRPSLGH